MPMRVKRAPSLQLPLWAALSVSLLGCNSLSGASDVSIDGTRAPTGGSGAAADGALTVVARTLFKFLTNHRDRSIISDGACRVETFAPPAPGGWRGKIITKQHNHKTLRT